MIATRASSEREVAEWVLGNGGMVIVHGIQAEITGLGDLPRDRDFDLQWVDFRRRQVGDEGLKRLLPLRNLQGLNATSTRITDAGLRTLGEKRSLVWLWVSENGITDAGLKPLSQLRELTCLSLSGTNITDDGLQHLKPLRLLTHLELERTDVGDHGVGILQTLSKIKCLCLYGDAVTTDAVNRFRKAVPGCEVLTAISISDKSARGRNGANHAAR